MENTPAVQHAVQQHWQRSQDIGELAAALAKAQGSFAVVAKDREAKVQSDKGNYSYGYATLASVQASTRPALSANGLALTQLPDVDASGRVTVCALLIHSSGQWISVETSVPPPPAGRMSLIQSIGGAMTFAKRYQWSAICGVSSEDEDDDAADEPQARATRAPEKREAPSLRAPAPAPSGAPVTDVPFVSAAERAEAARNPAPSGDWSEVVKGAIDSIDALGNVALVMKGIADAETIGLPDDDMNAVRRAAMLRMIAVAGSPAELAVAAKLGSVTIAPAEWHTETKRIYAERSAKLRATK